MNIDEIVGIFVNNGIGVACIVYFIFRDYKFMNTLSDTLSTLKESVNLIEDYFIKTSYANSRQKTIDDLMLSDNSELERKLR